MCGRYDLINKGPKYCNLKYYLCSAHFAPSQFKFNRLDSDSIPSVFTSTVKTYVGNELGACTSSAISPVTNVSKKGI